MRTQCQWCQQPIEYPDEMQGMNQECPSCSSEIVLPKGVQPRKKSRKGLAPALFFVLGLVVLAAVVALVFQKEISEGSKVIKAEISDVAADALKKQVSGQIFITMRNGNAVKLSSVEVLAIKTSLMAAKLESAVKAQMPIIKEKAELVSESENRLNSYRNSPETWLSYYEQHKKMVEDLQQSASLQFLDQIQFDEVSAVTRTDADGKFSFKVREDVVIVARAKREVVGKTEQYVWIVEPNFKEPMMLENGNMLVSEKLLKP